MAYENSNPYEDGPPMASGKGDMDKPDASEHEDGMVTTIPSAMCPGMKEGEEIVLHIDKVSDGEYVVSYAPEKDKKEEEPARDQPPEPQGDLEMASMME